MICLNQNCRHVEAVHDEYGCLMLGCPCGRMRLSFLDRGLKKSSGDHLPNRHAGRFDHIPADITAMDAA